MKNKKHHLPPPANHCRFTKTKKKKKIDFVQICNYLTIFDLLKKHSVDLHKTEHFAF